MAINPFPSLNQAPQVEEIAEAVAKLPPNQLGRFAGRAFAELKKRAKEP